MSASPRETVVITGGGGYFGHRLGCRLFEDGMDVVLFDIRKPVQNLPEGIRFIQGDIRSLSAVEDALTSASCVIHTASYGMSGREQLQTRLIEEVNVKGTENVLQACVSKGVPRLVYTSTFNVVFGGQTIRNGDESMEYLPLHRHADNYSRTKAIAEMKVLQANGLELADKSGFLRTCALRSAGIYGPGEQRHLPRIIKTVDQGLFMFLYGDHQNRVQFVHVDNLVSAHVLAAEALAEEKNHIAAGKPYFIADCQPVDNFEFLQPFIEGLGYKYPTFRLPLFFVYLMAYLTEWLHYLVRPLYNFQPLLTRAEVYKTGVTHYFNLDKAKRELGYEPKPFKMSKVTEWYKAQGYGKRVTKGRNYNFLLDLALCLLFIVVLLAWFPKVVG
ncbi:short-chain dehydrogenase/reductase family 42E member 1 [Rana temporaria]|uniref:short-chain dehydrogenase/reductase family 42E member 1 n=1 Tax=Rana temporaria TaxID=8407 RepID=UPI001AAD9E53|nr:short-chain dehydrogenase/reductase family 42E member 1 [Rana temporaria]